MTPHVMVAWPPAAASMVLRETATGLSQRLTNGTVRIHTHTLSAEAEEGDFLLFATAVDGSGAFTFDKTLTEIAQVGGFRHTGWLWHYTITAADVTNGSVAVEFTCDASERWSTISVEVAGINTTPVQSDIDNTVGDRETAAGVTLNSVASGNLLLAVCAATPDGYTNGLTVTNARSFTTIDQVRPTTANMDSGGGAGFAQVHLAYRFAPSSGSFQGPDYANDSTTGPGNVINPALFEFAEAA